MIAIFSLLICHYQAQTTTNTCQNEPAVYKLDIRSRIKTLCDNCTIEDVDYNQICQEVQEFDYIWLTQLWIPSIYNYKNLTNPEFTDNYREFENIKEYTFDPQLGTIPQLNTFLEKLKTICYHIKVLGEFSFYIGQDSSLLQNKTRFLTRPLSISFNEQNERYDDKDLVWAVNSKGQTIPYTAVWNYFQNAPLSDIQDIIYNQILQQYQLDGIVFLSPSLGLYSVAKQLYSQEVGYYGDSNLLYDFYKNFGIKFVSTNYYFMGDLDNINSKNLLLSAGLVQIYGQPPRSNQWLRINYTFSPTLHSKYIDVHDLKCTSNRKLAVSYHALVKQALQDNSQQCITFNFTYAYGTRFSGSLAGIINQPYIQEFDYQQPFSSGKRGLYVIITLKEALSNFNGLIQDFDAGFQINKYDKIQIQLDTQSAQNNFLVFRKVEVLNKNQTKSSFIRLQQVSLQLYRFGIGLYDENTEIEIAFPFHFSPNLKSSQIKINGDRHVECLQDSDNFQFALVFQTINQFEQNTTLNILALSIPSQSVMALGICDRDLIKINNYQINRTLSSGVYLYQSNGKLEHSNIQQYNNLNNISGFYKGDLVSITFMQSNYSVIFKNNNIFVYSMSLGKYVRNLSFCVGLKTKYQSVSLEY